MLSIKVLLLTLLASTLTVQSAKPINHRHESKQSIKKPIHEILDSILSQPINDLPINHTVDDLPINQSITDLPIKQIFTFAANQYQKIYTDWLISQSKELPDVGNATDKQWSTTSIEKISFVSAFFPGSLWLIYDYFGKQSINQSVGDFDVLEAAQQTTGVLAPLRYLTDTHDIGFEFLGSFVRGFESTNNQSYIPIILDAAHSLASRYSHTVGCTRSWNSDSGFLVIIDNMMNIELLFEGARLSSNRTLYDMAFSHARRTMTEHFRPSNHSTYHVVEYNENDGRVIKKMTNQGFADWSTWARGQSWAIHGFTTTYRNTLHEPFLETAVKAADLFIQQTFSQDRVHPTPYWDFNAPHGSEKELIYQPKDASAAAIAAGGMLELSTLVKDPSIQARLFNASVNLLTSLIDNHYNANNRFGPLPGLLNNCTQGPYHANDHTHPYDVFYFYGEYYFLQALSRLSHIQESRLVEGQKAK